MSAPTLSPEVQAFARLYARGVAPATAYRDAFKPDARVKRKAVWKRAQTLLARTDVAAYIEALRAEAAPKAAAAPGPSINERLQGMHNRSPRAHHTTGAQHSTSTSNPHGSIAVDDIVAAFRKG